MSVQDDTTLIESFLTAHEGAENHNAAYAALARLAKDAHLIEKQREAVRQAAERMLPMMTPAMGGGFVMPRDAHDAWGPRSAAVGHDRTEVMLGEIAYHLRDIRNVIAKGTASGSDIGYVRAKSHLRRIENG